MCRHCSSQVNLHALQVQCFACKAQVTLDLTQGLPPVCPECGGRPDVPTTELERDLLSTIAQIFGFNPSRLN